MDSISCSLRRESVPTAAVASALTRSSRGSARRRAAKSAKYATSSAAAASADWTPPGAVTISSERVRADARQPLRLLVAGHQQAAVVGRQDGSQRPGPLEQRKRVG
ncbi:hypothetical protein [Streptomyces sp. NPDC101455]|uniref:hypothetical protein n=1 Tax=Streptomyces sp. NPDC101455 TaxID=3366142 RepID=UPI003818F29A